MKILKEKLKVFKYDLEWQFFRNSLKNKKEPQKRIMIENFLSNSPSNEDKERLINYTKGCFYKEAITAFYINLIENTPALQISKPVKNLYDYSIKERKLLYKDLFNRNKKWLKKGYFNKDLNLFIDELSQSIPLEYRKTEELQSLRHISSLIENTWKFIY